MKAEFNDLRELASKQFGLFRFDQAVASGLSESEIRDRVGGEFRRETGHVLQLHGTPRTIERDLMCAILEAGRSGGLSHRSAAAWWGIPGYELRPIHVTRAHGGRVRDALAVIHEHRRMKPDHITMFNNIPVTTPARTVFDFANTEHAKRTERLLDAFWARHLVNLASLVAMLEDLQGKGRKGIRLMRGLLEARGENYKPVESNTEARFEYLCDRNGISGFERQVEVGAHHWVGRIDFLHRERSVIVEVQSELYHSALTDRQTDERRQRDLRAAGFVVIEAWDQDLYHRPGPLMEKIALLVAKSQT